MEAAIDVTGLARRRPEWSTLHEAIAKLLVLNTQVGLGVCACVRVCVCARACACVRVCMCMHVRVHAQVFRQPLCVCTRSLSLCCLQQITAAPLQPVL